VWAFSVSLENWEKRLAVTSNSCNAGSVGWAATPIGNKAAARHKGSPGLYMERSNTGRADNRVLFVDSECRYFIRITPFMLSPEHEKQMICATMAVE
jgi:hypothetical protein